jgi:hypothetical protein
MLLRNSPLRRGKKLCLIEKINIEIMIDLYLGKYFFIFLFLIFIIIIFDISIILFYYIIFNIKKTIILVF